MIENLETQSRNKSILFWIGMVSAIYEAVLNSLLTAGVKFDTVTGAVLGAIGVALATVLIYCNGNNPSLKRY